jgi:hypothetical protein
MKLPSSFLLAVAIGLLGTVGEAPAEKAIPNPVGAATSVASLQQQALKLPAEITLTLELREMHGIPNPKSFWEGVYELRVADWSDVVAKTKSGTKEDLGEVLLRSSFAHRAPTAKENRFVQLVVPVKGSLLERLRWETKTKQAFLLRATLRAYDGELDQNYAFELNRVWQSELFPDGKASITIALKPDGGHSTWGPIPPTLPKDHVIIGQPPQMTRPEKP